MGLFDKVKNKALNLFNKDFLKAVCSACALVAYADGEVTTDEVDKMKRYMQINKDLKKFKTSEVTENFERSVAQIEFDTNIGRMACFEILEDIKDDYDRCEKVVAVCIAIAKSDGMIAKEELAVIKDISSKLGVNMNNFQI